MAKFRLTAAAIIVIAALISTLFIQRKQLNKAKAETERLASNVRTLTDRAIIRRVRDSLTVAERNTLSLRISELEQLRAADALLIKDLNLKLRDIRNITSTASIIRDTVHLTPDTIYQPLQLVPPHLSYSDKWASFHYYPSDSTIAYTFRDSITTFLNVNYRRRFLWWRWSPHYQVTAVSHNPHCVHFQTSTVLLTDD